MSRGQRGSKLMNRLGERYDFRISNLKAIQVPKSWDRLFVSLVSVVTGKPVAKTGSAFVRNGSCKWSDVLSDSQGMEDCLLKLVVSMGSGRSRFLGEATLDIGVYAKQQLGTCAAVSLQLKKCNHGTILQLNLLCQTPSAKNRDNNVLSRERSSNEQVSSADSSTDLDFSSEKSEDVVARIGGSSSKKGLLSEESSFSTSDSYLEESSQVMEIFSQWDNRIDMKLNSNNADHNSSPEGIDPINAEKLMLEMEILEKECSDHPENHAEIQKLLEQGKEEKDQNVEQNVEREIVTLREELPDSARNKNEQDLDLMTENKELKEKMEDLERDCDELTNENLELLIRIKETNNRFDLEETDERFRICHLEERLKKKVMREIEEDRSYHDRELEGFRTETEGKVKELMDELSHKRSEVKELEANLESKKGENEELRSEQMELEARISEFQKQKDQMEEKMEIMVKENDRATKCLDELRKELTVASNSFDSLVSANRNLEKKSLQLQNEKCELEMELSKVSNESEKLLQEVSSLEAQVRDSKEEINSTRSLLENSKSYSTSLEDEITRYANDVESQKREMDEQLEDMHNRLLESQKELECLMKEQSEMQAFNEAISADCNSLRKANEELVKDNSELNDRCDGLADSTERIRTLQEALSSVQESSSEKIRSLMTEQKATSDNCKELEDELKLKESSWNQMYFEKTNEVVKLQNEIKKLSEQLDNECHERDSTAYEISCLRADKVNLETALKDAESRVGSIVSEMMAIKTEAEGKIKDLISELNTFNLRKEKQKSDHEKVLKFLEHYKVEEEKLKSTINDLELKLTVSEYEQQRLSEKFEEANVDMLRMEDTEEEICVLRIQLGASKSDKQNLEASLSQMSKERQSLKETISTLRNELLQMESDLEMRDSLSVTNRQKIQQLEQERGELIKLVEEKKRLNRVESSGNHYQREEGDGSLDAADQVDYVSKIKFLESELAKTTEASNMYKNRFHRLSKMQANSPSKQGTDTVEVETVSKERFERTKSTLETELKDIQERYYQMSLRYVEVEEQREELIMKLRESKNDKKLF